MSIYALILLTYVLRAIFLFVAYVTVFVVFFLFFVTLNYAPFKKDFLYYYVSIDAVQKMQCHD